MNTGILYYNHGERCLVRLVVSLHSLRKHYSGLVSIAAEGSPPEWFRTIAADLNAQIISAPVSNEYGLVKKSRIWRITPFEHTLFLDADTLIRAPIDELLDKVVEFGCIQTRFNDWGTSRGRMRRRVEQWRAVDSKLVDGAIRYDKAINTGVQGWSRNHPILEKYQELTERGLATKGIGKKTLDEIAMQILLPKYRHYLAPSEWNCGCVHNDGTKAKIVHYHGHKHCREGVNGDLWKAEFAEVVRKYPHYESDLKTSPDESIAFWLATQSGYRSDVTIVTACNPAYADRLSRNLTQWQSTPGLHNQRYIVFVNGFKTAAERKFLNRKNIKVIRWDYPFGATPRETMLAAFIGGVAANVRTKYWMKLDADTEVLKPFEWPDYDKFTITSHKWSYTKMKGDPDAKEHWFNRLDAFFGGHVFKRTFSVKDDFKVMHRHVGIPARFASFCHIEKTTFTKRMAKAIDKAGGRLPIPSHDTLSWYCSVLWGEKVQTVNFKEFFRP